MRKGVIDTPLRASVSQDVNNRFLNDLATLKDKTPVCDIMSGLTTHLMKNGRRFRGLDPVGKDQELILALSDPAFFISGFTNKMLREQLTKSLFGKGRTEKQLSAKISRHLRLLRVHGIIRKLPNQNRYQVSLKGARLIKLLSAMLAASIEEFLQKAA